MLEDPYSFLNRHVEISPEIFDKLKSYHDLLIKWQSKINLVGPDTMEEVWQRHFLDSLQLLKYIPEGPGAIVDLGSGAGFPGMVLALFLRDEIHLIESDQKKIVFLQEVARVTGAQVIFYPDRIEKISPIKAKLITARALSDLTRLFEYSIPHVSHGTICLFQKGKNYSKEIEDALRKWQFDYKIIPSVTDSQGVIVQISNLRHRP